MTEKKKTLLEEGTVRQFMKLANLKPLASDFVEKIYEGAEIEEDLDEDKDYTAKKEKAGDDKRKGAEKRGGEGTLAKTKGHGKVDYVNEKENPETDYAKRNSAAADAESLAEDDSADDDFGGNLGDESETDPGHIDYEGEPIGDEGAGGDVDIHSLVRAIAGAIESETGVSVDVAEEEEAGEEELEDTAALDDEEVDLGDEADLEAGIDDIEEVISTIAENVTKRLAALTKQKKSKKKVRRQ